MTSADPDTRHSSWNCRLTSPGNCQLHQLEQLALLRWSRWLTGRLQTPGSGTTTADNKLKIPISHFCRISGSMTTEWLPSGWVGGRAEGRKETAMSEPTYPRAYRITEFGSYISAIHSSLFAPNFMNKFASEDLKNQSRVRPPPSETAFLRLCGYLSYCWDSCLRTVTSKQQLFNKLKAYTREFTRRNFSGHLQLFRSIKMHCLFRRSILHLQLWCRLHTSKTCTVDAVASNSSFTNSCYSELVLCSW